MRDSLVSISSGQAAQLERQGVVRAGASKKPERVNQMHLNPGSLGPGRLNPICSTVPTSTASESSKGEAQPATAVCDRPWTPSRSSDVTCGDLQRTGSSLAPVMFC